MLFSVILATMMVSGQVLLVPVYLLLNRLGRRDTPLAIIVSPGARFGVFVLHEVLQGDPQGARRTRCPRRLQPPRRRLANRAAPVTPGAGQEMLADYAPGGLALKVHPVSLVRSRVDCRRVIPANRLQPLCRGRVQVEGLILIHQRPGTANGVVFLTIEDETGVANLIVRPAVFDAYRPAARHAAFLQAEGVLQRQGR